jgi:hypothetical protein
MIVTHEPVRTVADLETLDHDEIVAGYMEWRADDPEPGPNRSRAYWHGWRNAAIDHRAVEPDEASTQLAHEVVSTGWLRRSIDEHRRRLMNV